MKAENPGVPQGQGSETESSDQMTPVLNFLAIRSMRVFKEEGPEAGWRNVSEVMRSIIIATHEKMLDKQAE
jgi:hypothetical protein